jgi:hypothetical protein
MSMPPEIVRSPELLFLQSISSLCNIPVQTWHTIDIHV